MSGIKFNFNPQAPFPQSTETKKDYKPSISLIILLIAVSVLGGTNSSLNLFGMNHLSLTVGSAVLAVLLHFTDNILLGISSAAASFAVSFIVTKSAIDSLPSLLILPVGYLIYLVSKERLPRLYAFIISSITIFAVYFGETLYSIYGYCGNISIKSVKLYYAPLIDSFREILSDSFITEIAGNEFSIFSSDVFNSYLNLLIMLSPAAIFAILSVFAMLSSWLYKAILGITSGERATVLSTWSLEPSPVSGVVFCLAVIFGIFSKSGTFVWLSAMSIFLVLLPMFFFSGIGRQVTVKMIDGVPSVSIGRAIALVISLLISIPLYIVLGTFFGTFDSIKRFFPQKDESSM